jgi:XTP/dITP diphosphohydrolase/tetrapyrrole methylase family protein/MazG family protein/ATP diphosphatase
MGDNLSKLDRDSELAALDEITRQLRRECPWDREQDERSIVPHTVEEAYELAAAVQKGDDSQVLDELGDVLFQVYFLSLLLEERGAGSLAEVARHCREKLIRRHPHIFGEQSDPRRSAATADEVLGNWDQIKREERDQEKGKIFSDLAENLPATTIARKVMRQAAGSGFDYEQIPYENIRLELEELEAAGSDEERFHEVGDLLMAVVGVARKLKVDPELSLNMAARRFRERITTAAELASADGLEWESLELSKQIEYWTQAKLVVG